MKSFLRSFGTEALKIKHTPLLWLHLILPLVGVALFLFYSALSAWDTVVLLTLYFEALALAFPMLIGIVCGMAASQEEQAGGFQNMLGVLPSRLMPFLSKAGFLAVLGLGSLAAAIGLYGAGFALLPGQQAVPALLYLKLAGVLFGTSLFLYLLHLWIGLRFGKGASISVGVAGSLVSALMLTGLGDGIWYFIPWAWGVRLSDMAVLNAMTSPSPQGLMFIQNETAAGWLAAGVATLLLLAFCLIWFKRWEGRSASE
ncbi:lantibiotic immunity ABC transporter MutG family permease subunit [Eubacterium sp. 1001713B170207_170306_E7]|uniref:lantibiotic immunity ABC transporter MutG family permease subunit n=1 Tax=Eubacterium sp. 1001713B170207_170306_E7 TaxID=2787097 RepID=UPI0018990594|nr:lantibiotic immunity ABC transporter MutG family permease subunit [Eubacterium sp. 1001713B170207_170306_E7]